MKYVEAQRRGYPIGTGVTEVLSNRFAALHRELGATYAARVKEAA